MPHPSHRAIVPSSPISIPSLTRPFIQSIFEHVRTVKEAQSRLNSEASECDLLVSQLDACIAAAEKWDGLRTALAKHRSMPPLEMRLYLALEGPTRGFEREALVELCRQWGGDENHMLGKDAVRTHVVKLKNRGEFRIDGSRAEVESQVDAMFDRLVTADHGGPRSGGAGGSEARGALVDFPAVLTKLGMANREHVEKGEEMNRSIGMAEAEAKELQVACAGDAAKRDMRAELQRKSSRLVA